MHLVLKEFLFSKMYLVILSSISGDAGDSLANHSGIKFSTEDEDNRSEKLHCAKYFQSAWWYNSCYLASLNGVYSDIPTVARGHGIQWSTWKEKTYSLKKSEMKIRPRVS